MVVVVPCDVLSEFGADFRRLLHRFGLTFWSGSVLLRRPLHSSLLHVPVHFALFLIPLSVPSLQQQIHSIMG